MAKVQYISSRGKVFNLLSFDYAKLSDANFHKYAWGRSVIKRKYGEIVNEFTKEAQYFECTFKFRGNPSRRAQQIEEFHFETEYDITHKTPGRLIWDKDYIPCYFVESSTYPEEDGSIYTANEGVFYAPYPFWIEEKIVEIFPTVEGAILENSKGYVPEENRYGYPYSYCGAPTSVYIDVDSYADCDFQMTAYGPAPFVQWTIGNHIYKVDYALRENQYMVIDSRQNTEPDRQCYVVNESGIITNVFNYREGEIFKKIPSGNAILNYPRTYGLRLTIFIERSEPR